MSAVIHYRRVAAAVCDHRVPLVTPCRTCERLYLRKHFRHQTLRAVAMLTPAFAVFGIVLIIWELTR